MTFSMPSLALILGRLTVRMESLLLFLNTVLLNSLTAWSNCFVCVSTSAYLSCCVLTFNLSLKKVTAPILLTTAL